MNAPAAPVAPPPSDYTESIRALATPFEGKKVHVTSFPEKKERNVRKVVLPEHAHAEPLVAIFDLTTFGSAKDAAVFTPTHCYAHELDERAAFALCDLQAVHGFEGMLEAKIAVEIRGVGRITMPCGSVGDPLLTVLQGLAR